MNKDYKKIVEGLQYLVDAIENEETVIVEGKDCKVLSIQIIAEASFAPSINIKYTIDGKEEHNSYFKLNVVNIELDEYDNVFSDINEKFKIKNNKNYGKRNDTRTNRTT